MVSFTGISSQFHGQVCLFPGICVGLKSDKYFFICKFSDTSLLLPCVVTTQGNVYVKTKPCFLFELKHFYWPQVLQKLTFYKNKIGASFELTASHWMTTGHIGQHCQQTDGPVSSLCPLLAILGICYDGGCGVTLPAPSAAHPGSHKELGSGCGSPAGGVSGGGKASFPSTKNRVAGRNVSIQVPQYGQWPCSWNS